MSGEYRSRRMAERSDRDLLTAWGGGDLQAGRALFDRHFDSLHRFFHTKTENGVEDLIQQTLLACVEGRARFRGDSSFRTYMFQVARFQLYAHYRARNREREFDCNLLSATELAESPSAALVRQEDARLLLQALRTIPIDAQMVLELWFWEELTGPEIAEVLGIAEPTVRSRLRRALERLREQLEVVAVGTASSLQTDDDLQRWAGRLRAAVDGKE
jgi:RNA polymerase sigma-70 factor (ECF subfamily)